LVFLLERMRRILVYVFSFLKEGQGMPPAWNLGEGMWESWNVFVILLKYADSCPSIPFHNLDLEWNALESNQGDRTQQVPISTPTLEIGSSYFLSPVHF